ncbi:MAG: hypothetical protein GXO82_07340 [Chlorobi bacterium]|nr:hypothetical protein [Chlorobiota bacterium]
MKRLPAVLTILSALLLHVTAVAQVDSAAIDRNDTTTYLYITGEGNRALVPRDVSMHR